MKLRSAFLQYKAEGGAVLPVTNNPFDKQLHRLAVQFAERELSAPLNFMDYSKHLVVYHADASGMPQDVKGLACGAPRFDWGVWRFVDGQSGQEMYRRASDFLADNGARGSETFVFVGPDEMEDPTKLCPARNDWLNAVGARIAHRYAVLVK